MLGSCFFSRIWLSDADLSPVICSSGQTLPQATGKCGREEQKGNAKGKVDRGEDQVMLPDLKCFALVLCLKNNTGCCVFSAYNFQLKP